LGFTRTIAAGIHGAEMVFHGGLGLESRERWFGSRCRDGVHGAEWFGAGID